MKRIIIVLCVCLFFCISFGYGQSLDSAYKMNDINLLDNYMESYRSGEIGQTGTLDSLMSSVIMYLGEQKETKIKPHQYILLQPEIPVGISIEDDFNEKWNERTLLKKRTEGLTPTTYRFVFRKKNDVFFVPLSIIKEFDDFITFDIDGKPLTVNEVDSRSKFLAKRIRLITESKQMQAKENQQWSLKNMRSSKSIYYNFKVDHVVFNSSRDLAVVEVTYVVSLNKWEIGHNRYSSLLYMSKQNGNWQYNFRQRAGWF